MRRRWRWQWGEARSFFGYVIACWAAVGWLPAAIISPGGPTITELAIWLGPPLLDAAVIGVVLLVRNPPLRRVEEQLPDLRVSRRKRSTDK